MKKNAIIIAGIMFAAGSAVRAADYGGSTPPDISVSRSTELTARNPQGELVPPSDPSLSTQYDPASRGSFGTGEYGSHNSSTSVRDYHADSSVRGGSNEARGVARSHLGTESSSRPMDPAIQADSSIRGGSNEARGLARRGLETEGTSHPIDRSIKADSSIRGGSNEARGGRSRDAYSLRGSSNWNASDDLMRDGTMSHGNDASIGGAAVSSSGNASSQSPLDDMTAETGHAGSARDLNTSKHLEQNISGDYDLNKSSNSLGSEVPSDTSFSTEAVGGPGSVQTGSSTSSDLQNDSTPVDTTTSVGATDSSGAYLWRNNRAQGVGSAAAGQSESMVSSDQDLAQRVKATLTRESTGTFGATRSVARNIDVSSHGSTVTLKGTVPNQRDKDMLEIRAREISGVQKVDNQLTVSPQADPNLRDIGSGHDLEDRLDRLQK